IYHLIRRWLCFGIFACNLCDRGDRIAFVEIHDADALRVSPDNPDFVDVCPIDHALSGDEHNIIVVMHADNANHQAIALAGANVANALAAAPLLAIAHIRPIAADLALQIRFGRGFLGWFLRHVVGNLLDIGFSRLFAGHVGAERRALPESIFAERQKIAARVGDHHADNFVVLLKRDPLDPFGITAHGASLRLVKANRHSLSGAEYNFVSGLRLYYTDERVAIFEMNADNASALGTAIFLERRLFHEAPPRGHQQVAIGSKTSYGNEAGN